MRRDMSDELFGLSITHFVVQAALSALIRLDFFFSGQFTNFHDESWNLVCAGECSRLVVAGTMRCKMPPGFAFLTRGAVLSRYTPASLTFNPKACSQRSRLPLSELSGA